MSGKPSRAGLDKPRFPYLVLMEFVVASADQTTADQFTRHDFRIVKESRTQRLPIWISLHV
jgi:hypothetical protein